ncbi:MAG: ABC transporter permease [Oscillospiraceae bacterium]|jgi:putative ABC transport system permease protein|nr:ABC transporter permease [Oscillospiraceae bacterium]
MNIFNKITLQSLKKNRTRTVVTIVGVILSVTMIAGVTTFISSLQNYLIQEKIVQSGDWHIKFTDVDFAFSQKITTDSRVKTAAVAQNVGYALLPGGQNPLKPYLFLSGVDDTAFSALPIHIKAGQRPRNSGEILIPKHVETNGGVSYKIGDKVTLSVGNRLLGDKKLGQQHPFQSGEAEDATAEIFLPETTKTYTVVGIYERPGFEAYPAPGYTAITKMDSASVAESDSFTVFTALKRPGQVYDFAEKTADGRNYELNQMLLRLMGISNSDNFNRVLYSFAGFLIVMIMAGSILLIYNSFAISVSERSRQFGVLSSVGATKKQLRKSVLFEGICIGSIGIPIGLLAGVGGIGLTLRFIGGIFKSISRSTTSFSLSLSVPALVTAAALGIVTILLSAYIPAKRAVKQSAIETIRQTNNVKINAKSVKTPAIIGLLFGLEGTLAFKNLKRNKKRYRSTVISLFVSVVLFISTSALGLYLKQSSEITISDYGYDLSLDPSLPSAYRVKTEDFLRLYENLKHVNEVYDSSYYINAVYDCKIPVHFFEQKDNTTDESYDSALPIFFIEDSVYLRYLRDLGLPAEEYTDGQTKLPAVASLTTYNPANKHYETSNLFNADAVSIEIVHGEHSVGEPRAPYPVTLTIVDQLPKEVPPSMSFDFCAFAPYSLKGSLDGLQEPDSNGLHMIFLSNDPTKSANEMETIVSEDDRVSGYTLLNVDERLAQNRNAILIINIFTYGFVILISLITIANVFNTISTGIRLRRREFAMLRSMGLGDRSFDKMMNFECIFYGLKALLYGLPASAVMTWLIYKIISIGVSLPFILPWSGIAISVFSVFFVVFVTMIYAVNQMKNVNVIDALRDEVI